MPTQRRRIGFLPSSEVQNIIEKICTHNKLSQSKVTGILVEEALSIRGVLNSSVNKLSLYIANKNDDALLTTNKMINHEILNDEGNINLQESCIKNEVKMINDFVEFKFFKKIMSKNKVQNK